MFVDAVFKYDGWAFQGAYMNRLSNNPITINPDDIDELRYADVGEGYDAQLSYLFENNYEVIGRFSNQKPNEKIENLTPQTNQYSLGLTK